MRDYQYNHLAAESKWQEQWERSAIYQADKDDLSRPKFYALGMFPYPSGNAHMGHVRVFTLTDLMARYKRMKGFNVLNPIGWDSFGLPAENAARKHKVTPAEWTHTNIERMKYQQLNCLGFSFDWTSELTTSSPEYYQWTQWLFIQLFNQGMVEKRLAPCNWCSQCKTVLANEQVLGDRCWRCDTVVELKEMEQWFVKITRYAKDLYDGLDELTQWPKAAINLQREWIGRKEGALIDFPLVNGSGKISVFSTRPDTLFGVVALVLAFDHPAIQDYISSKDAKAVEAFCGQAKQCTEMEIAQKEDISGFLLDVQVRHPFTQEVLPVFIGDYVLASFGTGAVMCVPAHDKRDFRFAKKYRLEVKAVIVPEGKEESELPYTERGILVQSGAFSSLSSEEAFQKIVEALKEKSLGKEETFYRLKDWSISRQRLWGAPIPLKRKGQGKWEALSLEELPLTLEQAREGGSLGLYESGETLDTFLCSSWYFYRFLDPNNKEVFVRKERLDHWLPIDFYVGGMEHAAQHLIYARFLCKFLHDRGLLSVREPVHTYLANGLVKHQGKKMSKSKGNEVVPTEMVKSYGADALRMFILGDFPPSFDIEWSEKGLAKKRIFLDRLFLLFQQLPEEIWRNHQEPHVKDPLYMAAHQFIQNVSKYIEENQAFNNVISEMHSLFNTLFAAFEKMAREELVERGSAIRLAMSYFLLGSAPVVPFLTEELWNRYLKKEGSIHNHPWPKVDEEALRSRQVAVAVQVQGKLVEVIAMDPDLPQEKAALLARQSEKVARRLEQKTVKKIIFIPNKIINFVVE